MKTHPIAKSRASLALLTLLLLCFSSPSLRAEVFGLFTYRVVGGATVEITDYPDNAASPVVIPAQIASKPVTSIGTLAFYNCTGLTSVTIPNSVTSIGDAAFADCTGLTSVTISNSVTSIGYFAFGGCMGLTSIAVDPLNPSYVGLDGVLFNKSLTILLQYPNGKAGSYTIPNSVTSIEWYAFYGCTGLTSVMIPNSVTSIGGAAFSGCTGLTSVTIAGGVTLQDYGDLLGSEAFYGCSSLTKAVFLGNAPVLAFPPGLAEYVFYGSAQGFTIHYLSGSMGFTSPFWYGYRTTMINQATWPAASWLLTHGFWYDTNLNQDPNGDGVSLLMAFALNLDPHLNLPGSLPQPVLGVGTLSLSFHATSPGITYIVETSTELQNWTTQGVVQTAPGPDGRATATVPRDAPSRFLRLVVAR